MKNAINWKIDESHSKIAFKIRHLMISHINGYFANYRAEIITMNKDFLFVDIDLIIDSDSICTDDLKRDEHLRSNDFLDVKHHPKIVFTSHGTGLKNENGIQVLWGDLTIKNITKRITLNVEFGGLSIDPYGNEKAGFAISGKINRSDWGLTWNATLDSGGYMVSNEIHLNCEIELINLGNAAQVQEEKNLIIGN